MKKTLFPWAAILLLLTSACKTTENRESAMDSKRAEMEAITNKYLSMSPTASVDWAAFHSFFSNDAIIEQLDLVKYDGVSTASHSIQTSWRFSGKNRDVKASLNK